MKEEKRIKLVTEIYDHTEFIGGNTGTVVFLLATLNDYRLIEFHKTFLQKQPYDKKQQ